MGRSEYFVVQDGAIVQPEVKQIFSEQFRARDIVMTQQGERYNFVGFILKNDRYLVSFPKNSFTEETLQRLENDPEGLQTYMRILFHCIRKTASNHAGVYADVRKELNAIYPFQAFYTVYEYYQRYGLFTKQEEVRKVGYAGKISWKHTLNEAPKVMNHGNLLFLPFIVRENIEQHVFISKCMAYVIDTTLAKFSFFLQGERTQVDTRDIARSNKRLIITKLREAKRSIFKDVDVRLINALLAFFESEQAEGQQVHLKIYSFHLVWESMVEERLQTRFSHVSDQNALVWAHTPQQNAFTKRVIYPDVRGKEGYRIEPDYYFDVGERRYIFDAKYYTALTELDYKQIAYYFLTKHYEVRKSAVGAVQKRATVNGLMLPTEKDDYHDIHFQLKQEYNLDEEQFMIIAYYFNTFKVMREYVGMV